jgi:hypothetical protein
VKNRLSNLGEHWLAFSVVVAVSLTFLLFELADNLS